MITSRRSVILITFVCKFGSSVIWKRERTFTIMIIIIIFSANPIKYNSIIICFCIFQYISNFEIETKKIQQFQKGRGLECYLLLLLLFIYCHQRMRTSLDHLVLISSLNSYWSKIYIPQWLGKIQALCSNIECLAQLLAVSYIVLQHYIPYVFCSNFVRMYYIYTCIWNSLLKTFSNKYYETYSNAKSARLRPFQSSMRNRIWRKKLLT